MTKISKEEWCILWDALNEMNKDYLIGWIIDEMNDETAKKYIENIKENKTWKK